MRLIRQRAPAQRSNLIYEIESTDCHMLLIQAVARSLNTAFDVPRENWTSSCHINYYDFLCLYYIVFITTRTAVAAPNGRGKPCLQDKLPKPITSHSFMSLRNSSSLAFPPCHSSHRLKSFLPSSVPLWNALSSQSLHMLFFPPSERV